MTKELSAKRKVDKCRDTHPRRGARAAAAGDQWGAQRGPAPRPLGCRGCAPRPVLEARPYWIRLIIRFRVGRARGPPRRQKLTQDPIPSVIGIIRYTLLIQLCGCEPPRAAPRRDARPARRAACLQPSEVLVAVCHAVSWSGSSHGVRILERGRRRVRRRLPGLGRRRAVVGRAGLLRPDVAGRLSVPGHALPAATAAVRAPPRRHHEEPPHIPPSDESAT